MGRVNSIVEKAGGREDALAGAVLAAAFLVRLPEFFTVIGGVAQDKVLWFDEAYSSFMASQPLWQVIRLSGADSTPGLFAVLLHFWQRLFGDSTVALAILPFALNVASVWLFWRLAADLFGKRVGLVAMALLAVNPLHVKFATEVRTYSLLFCLSLLSLSALRGFLKRQDVRSAVPWVVWSVLGLYAHYTFIFFFALQNVAIAWRAGERRGFSAMRTWFVSLAAVALASSPLLFLFRRWGDFVAVAGGPSSYFSRAFSHGDIWSVPAYFAALLLGERGYLPSDFGTFVLSLVVGLAGAVIVGYQFSRERRDEGARLFGLLAFGGIAAFLVAGFVYDPRYFLIYVTPTVILLASWLVSLSGRALRLAAVATVAIACVALVGSWSVTPAVSFKYYAPAFAERVRGLEQPGDVFLADHFTELLFRRYYRGAARVELFFPMRGGNVTDMLERFRWFDYDFISENDYPTIERLVGGARRVWTVDYAPQRTSIQDPQGLKRQWFDRHYVLKEEFDFPPGTEGEVGQKVELLLYERLSD